MNTYQAKALLIQLARIAAALEKIEERYSVSAS